MACMVILPSSNSRQNRFPRHHGSLLPTTYRMDSERPVKIIYDHHAGVALRGACKNISNTGYHQHDQYNENLAMTSALRRRRQTGLCHAVQPLTGSGTCQAAPFDFSGNIDSPLRESHAQPTNGPAMKYAPSRAMTTPAQRRNHMPAPCQALFSVTLRTRAVELPATAMGRQ